jgi:asparagine synthase (glutamine-hydrolysing)
MCGFAGIYNLTEDHDSRYALVEKMIDSVSYRGPDDKNIYLDEHIAFAHTRLSIIDIAGGRQPMFNEDGTVCVIFTGEIFNYRELRVDLRRSGHKFKTESDTEVLVHLYEDYDTEFVHHLNGQFAIALWDKINKKMILARDRTGIRPLFYHEHNGTLYFSSEVKSLFTNPTIRSAMDPVTLAETFTFWSPLPGKTIFKSIKTLHPGEILVARAGETRKYKYWDWNFSDSGKNICELSKCEDELYQVLIDSVSIQTRADVPIGVYLSGGIDSAIIAGIIRQVYNKPLKTFSVTFEQDEFNEQKYQDLMARELGSQHQSLVCRRSDIGINFPKCIWHMETPVLRTAPVPLMLLSELVHSHDIKVILTGEGADEVFCGYDIFKESKIMEFWFRNINSSVRSLLFKRLYPYLKNSPTAIDAYTREFYIKNLANLGLPYFGHLPRWETTGRIRKFFSPHIKDEIKNWSPYDSIPGMYPEHHVRWDTQQKTQYTEAQTLLSGYILSSQGDRVSMANSVECRHPFLDNNVVEFANNLPSNFKLLGLREKHILKQAVSSIVPEVIMDRSKQPYRAPDSGSFFEDGKPMDYVSQLFSRENIDDSGLFDSRAVNKLYNKCAEGRSLGFIDNMAFIGILSTLLVHHQFIEQHGITN